ncbi:MAG: hypothetical protein HRT65_00605 [Flavobacteriaceae bacterium]|nr:hypothetical protein [Flavobacteriaceae bacterium]
MKSRTILFSALLAMALFSCNVDSVQADEDLYTEATDGNQSSPKDGKD